jgi:aromatic-amino-acid transaminase
MGLFRADTRIRKMDLGVGVYRDAFGHTPVFAAVKRAEKCLAEDQMTKSYLGSEGDPEFLKLIGQQVFGHTGTPGLQTVGGTGALRLAADLLARSNPQCQVWVGLPTWPNHLPIFKEAGLRVATVDTFDPDTGRFRPNALLDALQNAARGDAVLLHACCQNPTGVDPAPDFWPRVAEIIAARGLVALVDSAYQGLGQGWHEDGAGLNTLITRVPHVLVAYSCDKNFGLYRERVGALFVSGTAGEDAKLLCNHLSALARANYSMPPDHGAAIVRVILQDPALTDLWRTELNDMRARMQELRAALASYGRVGAVDLNALRQGNGMFAMLPLSLAEIARLQHEFGIYIAPNGRMNIAGLAEEDIERFVDALRTVQSGPAA